MSLSTPDTLLGQNACDRPGLRTRPAGWTDIIDRVSALAYTVIAETDSEAAMRAYVNWLTLGHIEAVIEAGALSATLIRHDLVPGSPLRAEVRYMFGSREAFEAYEQGPAVALRAEGAALFGPQSEHPIRFARTLGGVVQHLGR